jgi:hypothetical protein|nr:hypothetical protein [Roseburia inulinivorans]
MNTFEELQDEACKDGIEVIENYPFTSDRIEGLYVDSTIALSKGLTTCAEKSCVLAEELGHHYTASGDIIDQSTAENRKQELRGRIWAYNKQIGLSGLLSAYKHHCQNEHEVADFLGVTDIFLKDALVYYKNKYGQYTQLDNYIIFFEPAVAVMELI